MGRTVKKLSNLEIDEVSLVDRPANQHGLVAIAKSYQEDNMAVFDANGDEVFEEELSHGDLVYDEQGNEYVYSDGSAGDDEADYGDDGEEVGKGVGSAVREARDVAGDYWRHNAGPRARKAKATVRNVAQNPGVYGRRGAQATGRHLNENKATYIAGGSGTVGGGGAGYAVGHRRKETASKSLGEQVLTELSKALTEDDRDQVIAKALDAVSEIADRNAQLEDTVASMLEAQELQGYGQIAKSYGTLPVDDEELGGVLYRASQFLDDDDLAVLDRVLSGAGEITKAYFDEVGVQGYSEGGALDEVYAIAGNAVVKGAELGLSEEQAVTAVFDNNPAAYDMYEAEQRLR